MCPKTADLIGEISAASSEQAQGIDEVNTAVSEMDKITQQNAAGAEESASASGELTHQAEQMKTIVQELSLLVRGSANEQKAVSVDGSRGNISSEMHLFHQIAEGRQQEPVHSTAKTPSRRKPQDEDFDDFNA